MDFGIEPLRFTSTLDAGWVTVSKERSIIYHFTLTNQGSETQSKWRDYLEPTSSESQSSDLCFRCHQVAWTISFITPSLKGALKLMYFWGFLPKRKSLDLVHVLGWDVLGAAGIGFWGLGHKSFPESLKPTWSGRRPFKTGPNTMCKSIEIIKI